MSTRRRLTKAERKAVHRKTDGHCAYCGETIKITDMQVDRVISLRRNGADTLDNMLPACRSCNHYKSTLTLGDFREQLENMPKVLMRDSVTYKNAVRYGLVQPNPHHVTFYFEKLEEKTK